MQLYRCGGDVLANLLYNVLHSCWRSCCIPQNPKDGNAITLHKNNRRTATAIARFPSWPQRVRFCPRYSFPLPRLQTIAIEILLGSLRSVFLRLLSSQIYRQYCSSTAQGQEILMSLVVSSKVVYLLLLFSAILRFASPDGPGILLYFRSREISTILRAFVSKFRQVLVCQVLNAKDAGLVFQSTEVMQDIYNSSEPAWFKRGMSESLSKTILLYQNIPPVIMICCNNLSAVDMFCYLSFLVTSTNVLDAEIQERTGKAETVFNSFHECATITNFGFI